MIYVNLLATTPSAQGHGYGGALLDAVCAMGDAQEREVCLNSSNYANTGFYESHGFTVVGQIELGRDNPTWKKDPIIITWVSTSSQYELNLSIPGRWTW